MSIQEYRKVQYEDEGVVEYQCLSCYEPWGMRFGTIRFCPCCGIKFPPRRKCRERDIPRWAYDRYGNDLPPFGVRMFPERKQTLPMWVLERLWVGPTGENCLWEDKWRLGHMSAIDAYDELVRRRKIQAQDDMDDDFPTGYTWLYRVRIENWTE